MKIVFTTLATALLTTAVWAQTKQTDSLLQKEIALNEVLSVPSGPQKPWVFPFLM